MDHSNIIFLEYKNVKKKIPKHPKIAYSIRLVPNK